MKTFIQTEQEKEMVRIIQSEKTSWDEGYVEVTNKVYFKTTDIINRARRNFYGKFEQPNDPITGRPLVWVPLTEWIVETVMKNIDIDISDIRVEARKQEASVSALIMNQILKNKLEKIGFGKILNMNNQNIVIDGTSFLKAWKENGELKISYQDIGHIISDPTVQCLDQSSAVIEENVITLPEFREIAHVNNWKNIDNVIGETNVDISGRNSEGSFSGQSSEIPYVRVYERYGYAPKFVLTGAEEDRDNYIYTLAIVSEVDTNPVVHVVKQIKKDPYQTFKFKDVINRFAGRGIPEKLFEIQKYVNETVNTRLNTARIVQIGLWRVGRGVTSKQLKDLFSTAAIKANPGDIERLNTGTIDPSSYQDEQIAYEWARRTTQTNQDDLIAPNKPATNALIEERGASKAYDLIIEEIYLGLASFIEKKVIPIIIETLKPGEVEKITGDVTALEELRKPFVRNLVRQQSNKAFLETGSHLYNSKEEEDQAVDEMLKNLNNESKNNVFIPIYKKAFDTEYEIRIDQKNQVINKGVLVQQLTQVMSLLSGAGVPVQNMTDVMSELFDSMGMSGEKLVQKIGQQQQNVDKSPIIDQYNNMATQEPMEGNLPSTPVQ